MANKRLESISRLLNFHTLLLVGNIAIFLVVIGCGVGLGMLHYRNSAGVAEVSDNLRAIGEALETVTTQQQPFVVAASRLQAQVLDLQLELIQISTSTQPPGQYLEDKAAQLSSHMEGYDISFLDESSQFKIIELNNQVNNYSSIITRIPAARSVQQAQTMAQRALALGDQLIATAGVVEQESFRFIRQSNDRSLALATQAGNLGQQISSQVDTAVYIEIAAFGVILVTIVVLSTVIRTAVVGPLNQVSRSIQRLAEGDLTERMRVRGKDEIAAMGSEFNRAIGEVQTIVGQVHDSVGEVINSSRDLLLSAERLSTSARVQAESLEQTSAGLEVLTASTRENAERSQKASQLASANWESADSGGQVVAQAIAAMEKVDRTSTAIAENSVIIKDFAFQTNLLALNAAVEAAHAGDDARGFGVVAEEVRRLAASSKETAAQISLLVEDAVERAGEGAELVNQSGDTLNGIFSTAMQVNQLLGEISAASSEQASGIARMGVAVQAMDQMTGELGAQIDTITNSARSLAHLAEILQSLVQRFRIN